MLLIIQEILDTLVTHLTSLALIHDEVWTQMMIHTEDLIKKNDHFMKSISAQTASLTIYKYLWQVLQSKKLDDNNSDGSNKNKEHKISPYWCSQIALGISMGHFHLYNNNYEWHSSNNNNLVMQSSPSTMTVVDISLQYRNLLHAENWCKNSLLILSGIDIEDMIDHHNEDLTQTQETMALIYVRFGIFLLNIFNQGYVLDDHGNLHQEMRTLPPESLSEIGDGDELGEGQVRLLNLTTKRLRNGLAIYTELETDKDNTHNYRRDIADTRYTLGVANTHLSAWVDAAKDLETSLSLYEQLFTEYQISQLDTESLNVVYIIQTTQALWGAYFNMPDKTDDSKTVFLMHLRFTRYYYRRVRLDQPLIDDEDDDELSLYSSSMQQQTTLVEVQGGAESLEAYQMRLYEYLQQLSDMPPDGSYYDLSDTEATGIVQHDKVYEGSLHSAIGTLLLAKNDIQGAIAELELAVDLLRVGATESYVAYDENNQVMEYSVKQELANSLLNLAYAQKEIQRWNSAANSFTEAMDLYKLEDLLPGGIKADQLKTKEKDRYVASLGNKLTSFIKGQFGSQGGQVRNITLHNYQRMDNSTKSEL
jgi:tetratricopeptide (TPR) repeat protein